jgi:DNA topoisomerase-3
VCANIKIAKGLCTSGDSNQSGRTLPVHKFTTPGNFPKAPCTSHCHHEVTSVAGHVFSVDFPPQFQSWESVDPAELFTAPVVKKPNKGSVVRHLQDEALGVDFIVLWMDCDREGENINFEVLDCCMHLMKKAGGNSNYDRVYRAHFSAVNPSDIQKAYNALGKPDKNQALSVDARQELDLKVGVAFSRFQTRYFQGRYGDLDSAVLSYGPCQTPTLGFCVQRHVDIETFKPEPYWTLDLGVLKQGCILRATWGPGRSFNKNKVGNLVTKCFAPENAPATVQVANIVTSREKKQGRPIPLNTVALLKACSKALGIGPHTAMQTAERLYLSGYLSYPRTESSTYPKSFDIRATLNQQSSDHRWGRYVRELLNNASAPLKARGGADMGDHPPITPCREAGGGELFGDMARVYEFVVRHFIASVSPDAIWRSTKVDFVIDTLEDQGHFIVSGKELLDKGFLAVLLHHEYGDDKGHTTEEEVEEERAIPEFIKGETIPLFQDKSQSSGSTKVAFSAEVPCWALLGVKEKMTTPPGYLTESELISKMEKHGIGTDASIATHIQNIQTGTTSDSNLDVACCPLSLVLFLRKGTIRLIVALFCRKFDLTLKISATK